MLNMFCDKCGFENPDDATFCGNCGKKFNVKKSQSVQKPKRMLFGLIISFILTGLGIAYAGNVKKGVILFVVGIIFSFIGRLVPVCAIIGILIWAYALYATYNEVRIAQGVENPNMLEDFKTFPTSTKALSIIALILIVFVVIGTVVGAFMPQDDFSDVDYDDDYSSTGLSSSSSSSGSDSYSSSSNGRDVSSHYESEYGSADTHGRVYDDGSVESHQKGTTDYGDYQIDSYMDSNGNVHGSVKTGGQTYYVNN